MSAAVPDPEETAASCELEPEERRPPRLHVVLTGRDAHPEVIERAETVSEVREVKHAYRVDIELQPGVDY